MKMEHLPGKPDRIVLHIQRQRGAVTVPCRLVLQKGTGLVLEDNCDAPPVPVTQSFAEASLNADARRMRFFLDEAPCWFPDCEQMRVQFKQDKQDLGDDCMPCAEGELMRRYLAKMASMGV